MLSPVDGYCASGSLSKDASRTSLVVRTLVVAASESCYRKDRVALLRSCRLIDVGILLRLRQRFEFFDVALIARRIGSLSALLRLQHLAISFRLFSLPLRK